MIRVLHITNWYPTDGNPAQGIFVKEHITSLQPFVQNTVWHIAAMNNKNVFNLKQEKISDTESRWIAQSRFFKYYTMQSSAVFLLLWVLFRYKKIHKTYDVVNFHIAFPLLLHFRKIALTLNKPIVVTEHYSGYHFNFNLAHKPKKLKKLKKLKELFSWQKNWITVSKALAEDIRTFADVDDLHIEVVPNAVSSVFTQRQHDNQIKRQGDSHFCMITNWSAVKNPFPIFEAILKLKNLGVTCNLTVGGLGAIIPKMKDFVIEQKLDSHIQFVGHLNKRQVAEILSASNALLHNSHYETFSVICAESFSVGTPVIAAAVGGIKELIRESNGILVSEYGESNAWLVAIQSFIANQNNYDEQKIIADANKRFSMKEVGEQYYNAIRKFA